jgi:hypothetical protein
MAARQDVDSGMQRAVWRYHAAQLRFEANMLRLSIYLKAGFKPNQPRVPAGNPDGGQWTNDTRWAEGRAINRPQRAGGTGDSLDDLLILVGGGRGQRSGGGPVRVGNRLLSATPNQQTRLVVSRMEMESALRAVSRVDPNWRPIPQLVETVEGQIAANYAIALQARLRLNEIAQERIGPGPFAKEWMPAPPNRRLTRNQQSEINRIGRKWGCHTCGYTDPRTPSGNVIGDHQVPRSLGEPTRIYPHCLFCSATQGGLVRGYKRRGGK